MASAPARSMTAEDLWRMPDDGMRHELVRGELRTMPPASFEHGRLSSRIDRHLGNHVDGRGFGEVVAGDVGFRLPTDPESVRAPDVAFVVSARVEAAERLDRFFEGPPDLAVEVVSPGDTSTEVQEKALDWLEAGARLVLVVHPRLCTVTTYRSPTDIRILSDAETLDASDVVDGWVVPVGELLG